MGNLTPELAAERDRIRKIAESYGLDFYETIFELVDYDELNEVAAFGGFPRRYPYWRFGMEYEQLAKSYEYGLSKIYELVINNDPCYAYLMRSNMPVDQKLVMAHVYGHCDFFKNNMWFSQTNRKMMDQMANHGTRIQRYVEAYGFDVVESFLDVAMSLDNLIDHHSVYRGARSGGKKPAADAPAARRATVEVPKIAAKGYMDRYINPPEYLEAQRRKLEEAQKEEKRFPPRPEKDVLAFLMDFAPLEPWQRDVIGIVREEAYYFAPQAMTKIMNEGWASYWHSRIMTQHVLDDSEIVDFADHHSGTVYTQPGRINPYKLGIELFRDIERRWNMGQFGRDWEECDDYGRKTNWDTNHGKGLEKIFEVRRIYNDITFIEEFLTAEFAERQKLFVYEWNPRSGRYEIADRDYRIVKGQLLTALTNFGNPYIRVIDANYQNRGELYLHHRYDGVDLQFQHALETLRNLHAIWSRPVHLETREEGKGRLLSFDGKEMTMQEIEGG